MQSSLSLMGGATVLTFALLAGASVRANPRRKHWKRPQQRNATPSVVFG